jgi:hypothetical protein
MGYCPDAPLGEECPCLDLKRKDYFQVLECLERLKILVRQAWFLPQVPLLVLLLESLEPLELPRMRALRLA